jgi:hypothetical protein
VSFEFCFDFSTTHSSTFFNILSLHFSVNAAAALFVVGGGGGVHVRVILSAA